MIKEINPHFEGFLFDWEYKFYFLVGGYGSGKSYHVALKLIFKLLKERRTALVVREVFETIRESCFSLLCDVITDLAIEPFVKVTVSPMQIRFSNGSKIIFKGMDKPAKLKSINNISILWIEECSEIKYSGFKELLGRLRHPELPLHFFLSTNPVDKNNWSYRHFFKDEEKGIVILEDEQLYKKRCIGLGDIYYHHSTAEDNYFLPESYVEQLSQLEAYDPDLYRIARLGRFGVNGMKVLPQFSIKPHDEVMEAVANCGLKRAGMDFGFEQSYNALLRIAVDENKRILYIYWEYYKNHMTDDETSRDIWEFKQTQELIIADSAEPKAIKYYNQQGFRMIGAKKFPGSRLANIKKIKRFKEIVCSQNCPNTKQELMNLTFAKDRNDNYIPDEFNIDPHTLSAIWYALEGYEVADLKQIKEHTRREGRRRA